MAEVRPLPFLANLAGDRSIDAGRVCVQMVRQTRVLTGHRGLRNVQAGSDSGVTSVNGREKEVATSRHPLVYCTPSGAHDFTGRLKTNTIKVIGTERRVGRIAAVVTFALRLVGISRSS